MWSFKKTKNNVVKDDSEHEWSVFETKNDDGPMIVRLNQTAKKWAGKHTFDIRVGFAIPLNEPVANGYPSASENEALNIIEDQINTFVKAKAGSRYFCESLFWVSQPKQAAKT